MDVLAPRASLDQDEEKSADYGYEVQRQVHDVSNQSLGTEPLKGALENLAKLLYGIRAGLQLAALANDGIGISRNQGAVEGVKQRILEKPGTGGHVDDGGALVEDQEDCREDSQRAVEEDEDGKLGYVGEEKHAGHDSDGEQEIGTDAGQKRLPQGPVRGEEDDALNTGQLECARPCQGDTAVEWRRAFKG